MQKQEETIKVKSLNHVITLLSSNYRYQNLNDVWPTK